MKKVGLEQVALGKVELLRVALSPKRRDTRPPIVEFGYLLLEQDGYILLEDGGKIILNA